MAMDLEGRRGIERALSAVGERLAHAGEPCSIVVLGGAAINLLDIANRPTRDVDVLARRASDGGTIEPPDPLPPALRDAMAAVAYDLRLEQDWLNTTVADQWRFGLPPKDLLALRPGDEELDRAAEWVSGQDSSPDFHAVVAKVVAHVRRTLR